MIDVDYERIINNWINAKEFSKKIDSYGMDSWHIDDLIDNHRLSAENQVTIASKLYTELVKQYNNQSHSLMALLVIGLEECTDLKQYYFDDLLSGSAKLYPSPELYVVKRELNIEPYVVEEYKRPIKQKLINNTHGVIYAYYRLIRNGRGEPYSPGFYFEHYPQGSVSHNWK